MSYQNRRPFVSPQHCLLQSYKSIEDVHKKQQKESVPSMRVPVKSQFGADFRRISIEIGENNPTPTLVEFRSLIDSLHCLTDEQRATATLAYTNKGGDTLPLSNDDNLRVALTSQPLLRVLVRNKGEALEEQIGYGVSASVIRRRKKSISNPQDFRRVSSIVDADILPRELRRVRLCKFYNNKPLGFYIRDGVSTRVTPFGVSHSPGIFISRLLPNGLAASTNLLHVDDEILEVNGIEVSGKTLDQVTDIMIANSSSLLLTVRPPPPMLAMPPPPPYPHPFLYPAPFAPFGSAPYGAAHPGYGSYSSHSRGSSTQSYSPVPYSNLHTYQENRQPWDSHAFSRASTWRLSDKMANMQLGGASGGGASSRRARPLSVHVGMSQRNMYGGY